MEKSKKRAGDRSDQTERFNMNAKSILFALTAAYMVALLGKTWVGNTPYFDNLTLSLLLSLAFALVISLRIAANNIFPIIAGTLIYFLVYIFPRSLEYLYMPGMVVFPLISSADAPLINRGLLYFVGGTAFFLAGIHLAGSLFKDRPTPVLMPSEARPAALRDILPLSIVFVLSLLIMIVGQKLSGISVIGPAGESKYHILVQVSLLLFSIDTALICVVAAGVAAWKSLKTREFLCVGSILAAYLAATMYFGSRVGLLRILLAAIMAFFVVYRNKSFGLSKKMALTALGAGLFVVCIAVFGFQIGSAYRNRLGLESLERRLVAEPQNAAVLGSRIQQMKEDKLRLNNAVVLCSSILNRLNTVDFAILTSSLNRSGLPPSIYGDISYAAKSIANSIPGTPYPEADINTSQVHDIVYSGRDAGEVKAGGYFSRPWTIWGLGTLFTSTWLGYSALMLVAGFILQFFYWVIGNLSGHYALYTQTAYLSVVLQLVYFSMGVDHSVIVAIGCAAQTVVIIAFLAGAKKLISFTKPSPEDFA
jgi:hypothetical protein